MILSFHGYQGQNGATFRYPLALGKYISNSNDDHILSGGEGSEDFIALHRLLLLCDGSIFDHQGRNTKGKLHDYHLSVLARQNYKKLSL